jgi:hypothetical protein
MAVTITEEESDHNLFEHAKYEEYCLNAYITFFVRCIKDKDNSLINSKSNSDCSGKNAFYSVLEFKGP